MLSSLLTMRRAIRYSKDGRATSSLSHPHAGRHGQLPACYTVLRDLLVFLEFPQRIESCRARACARQVTGKLKSDTQTWRCHHPGKNRCVTLSRSAIPGMRLRARACLKILELRKPRATRGGKRRASQAACVCRAGTGTCSAFACTAPPREQLN